MTPDPTDASAPPRRPPETRRLMSSQLQSAQEWATMAALMSLQAPRTGSIMSQYVLSHAWEVLDAEDGLLVKVTPRDLDESTAMLLFDDLRELVQERGRANLYLDFGAVHLLSSAVLGRIILLDRKLRDAGGRLSLFNLNPPLRELLVFSRLTDILDVRAIPLPRSGRASA
jgi:anti-anti-sigma factor